MGLRQRGGSGKRSRGRRNAVDSSGPSRLIDSAQPDRTGYSRGPARAVHVAPSVVESAADLQVSAIAGPQSRPRAELALCRTTGWRVQGLQERSRAIMANACMIPSRVLTYPVEPNLIKASQDRMPGISQTLLPVSWSTATSCP